MEIVVGSRSMVRLIHADDFFPKQDVINLRNLAENLEFVEKSYGYEIPNFNLIFPDIEFILSKVLGERVQVDPEISGVIRKPFNNRIHFESFQSTEEWCFFVALDLTVINLWHHIEDSSMGELSNADSKNALEGIKYNYNNLFEWKIQTNILLEPNQCLFIRPWMFHSLQEGMVQYYKLLADKNYRVLVMGYPHSKKDSVAEKLSQRFEEYTLIDSMMERISNKDLDFTVDGHLRHCYRMLEKARKSKSPITIINMSCPLEKMRQILNPDIIVWVSDKLNCDYSEINSIYEVPFAYDIECIDDSEITIDNIFKKIMTKRI
jgi:hypothetical protein